MADQAHEWTDEQIDDLAKRMWQAYSQAANEMQDKLEKWLEVFDSQNRAWKKAVGIGIKTQEEYDKWHLRNFAERKERGLVLTYEVVANE